MKTLVLALGISLAVTTIARATEEGNAEDARLTAFFKSYLEEDFRRHPLNATKSGDHRYDDRLDDLSPTARAADRAFTDGVLKDLPQKIDFKKLSRSGQLDYAILEQSLKYGIWLEDQIKPYETNPRMWTEYLSDSVFVLLTQSTLPRETNVRNAASRIGYIPRVVAAAKASLKNPPRIVTETAIKQNRGSIAFYESDIFAISGETPQVSPLAAPCKQAIAALKEYQEFLEKELLPRSTGEWRIGRELFEKKLAFELDAGFSADEVLQEAEREADRVEREMVVIARQLWFKLFPGKPTPPDDPAGRREIVRAVLGELSKDHGKVENLVTDAKATVEVIQKFIREKDILRLPDPDRCGIIEMPEFQRGFSVAYLNPAPPLDPNAKSQYAVSPPPKDWDDRRVQTYLQEYNRYMLQVLTIHEAYPGHYVQLEYSNRDPSLVRKILQNGTFIEGWAVYTEQMMLDQGYGAGDLALRLHQLKFYLRAVVNAILDHKMHCKNISDEEAKELLVGRAFQSDAEAVGKIQRAKLSSCQLSTYFVGRMAHHRLRQSVQRELGDAFDLGRYHEAVLSYGSPPVKFLPELVRERLKKPR